MTKRLPYPLFRYDEELVLKVPVSLWVAMGFLVRHFVLLGVTFLPRTGDMTEYLRDLVDPIFLLSDLPAVIVLLAALRRRSAAARPVRLVWSRGRALLGASAVLYLGFLAVKLASAARPLAVSINEAVIASGLAHVLIIAYLARSRLVRDVFAQFP
jgi:hypothetical protein